MARGKRAEKAEKNGEANGGEQAPGVGHNAAPLTDDQMAALTFEHRRHYETALAAKKAADAELKRVCKVMKAELGAEGLANVKDMIELQSAEGEAKLKADIERQMKVARWMGMPVGAQSDMFGEDRTPAADRAFALGKKAGLAAENCSPPHSPETEQARRWIEGWHEGQAVHAKGFKPLTPVETAAKQPDARIAEASARTAAETAAADEAALTQH